MSQTAEWLDRWQQQKTGWDLGTAHPLLARAWDLTLRERPEFQAHRVYVPGCGHAHEAAFFAARGHDCTAEDISPLAVAGACNLYGHLRQLTLLVGDCLQSDSTVSFDLIVDRAVLCALSPQWRTKFVQACQSRLRKGGIFLSIPFTKVSLPPNRSGPPFAIGTDEINTLFSPAFSRIFYEEHAEPSLNGIIQGEALMAWELI